MPRVKIIEDVRMINMTTQKIYPTESQIDSKAQWYKTTRRSMVDALKVLGDPKADVFAALLQNMTYANEVNMTGQEISDAAQVSTKTVTRVLVTLEKGGVIKRIRNGRLMLDPQVMRHGKNAFAGYAKAKWEEL